MRCPYADKARLHDWIVQHVLQALQAGYTRGFKYHFGIENPDGELKYRPFMSEEQWPKDYPEHTDHSTAVPIQTPAKKANVILD